MNSLTVFDWLKGLTTYIVNDSTIMAIIVYRCKVSQTEAQTIEFADITQVQKWLMEADLIKDTVLFTPSGIANRSATHAGFSKSVGGQRNDEQRLKLDWAKSIYKKYDPDMLDLLSDSIKIVTITDKV